MAAKKKKQYDEFLHKIQQEKMKELWDNEEDEAWGDQDEIAKKRIADIKKNPSIGKSEADLQVYLKKRGIKIE